MKHGPIPHNGVIVAHYILPDNQVVTIEESDPKRFEDALKKLKAANAKPLLIHEQRHLCGQCKANA